MANLTAVEAAAIDASPTPDNSLYTLGTRIRNLELKATHRGFSDSLNLCNFREVIGDDIQTIATGNCGVLGSNNTNVRLNRADGATNRSLRIEFASNIATLTCEVTTQYNLPSNVDTDSPIVVTFRASDGGDTTSTLVVRTQFNEHSVTVSSATLIATAYSNVEHTIPAANIPASATSMTITALNKLSLSNDKNWYIIGAKVEGEVTPATS